MIGEIKDNYENLSADDEENADITQQSGLYIGPKVLSSGDKGYLNRKFTKWLEIQEQNMSS